ncbi:hypothetical protein Ddye_028574 [Dipteronia dyeriana]|uniref:Uncharacterized protein n=1 Tax=Dipteronia dyeriana TaxID=168575 RepID=A0AAD9WKM8_9ROSI|nr:hypothetical protein Ddye_028574 [Dipteronia dyeriana]
MLVMPGCTYDCKILNRPIVSQLKLYGGAITEQDMLEKIFATFHVSDLLLQQQYRERKFTKYSESISYLRMAEQNNEFLMKNHQSRPIGTVAFPEANTNSVNNRDGYRERGHGHYQGRGGHNKKSKPNHQKWNNNDEKQEKGKDFQNKPSKNHDNACFRCGVKGH